MFFLISLSYSTYYQASLGYLIHPGGRYIDIDFKNAKRIELDFNKSYNPFCVYDKKFSCPIPSKRNHIDIKIEAGEKI